MEESICLHIPIYEELWYREKIMQDSDTMSYNRGYQLNMEGYDTETGCIAFSKKAWRDWYDYFIGQEPERFYAYIARREDGVFIGEVNLHRNPDALWYDMGIVLEAAFRGKGYAKQALRLLLQYAFENMAADAVHNDFEAGRIAAIRAHLAAGFTKCDEKDGILEFLITREQYFRQRADEKAK